MPFSAHVFDVGLGALLRSYEPPVPAALLVATGRLTEDTGNRLFATARWLNAASVPGWLRIGEPGYVATAQVRVGHAFARRFAHRAGLVGDEGSPHPAINQVDMVRTWLDFTLAAPLFAEALGLALTPAEHGDLLRYWRHLGALLGIEPRLLAAAVDRESALELDARVSSLTGPPSADSRTLTSAGLRAVSDTLRDESLLPMPRFLTLPAISIVARAMHGPARSDALGIPRSGPTRHLVTFAAAVLRLHRKQFRRDPRRWNAAIDANIAISSEFALTGALPQRR